MRGALPPLPNTPPRCGAQLGPKIFLATSQFTRVSQKVMDFYKKRKKKARLL